MEGTANTIATAPALMTAEELLARSSELGRCELINGELRRMSPAGAYHGDVALEISGHLYVFVKKKRLGKIFAAETGFILSRKPDTVRAPDVMFLAKSRVPKNGIPDGFLPIAPDLAVEVVSPDDRFSEVTEKANSYLRAGVKLVWVVEPRARQAFVFQNGKDVLHLNANDALTGEDVLPGFTLPLAKLFERR
jgi:Uma2 family endonuclease